MSQYWNLRTSHELEMFNQHACMSQLAGKPLRVKIVDNRTLDQNGLSFALYGQIAAQIEDQSVNDIRAECKLTIGVGLLKAADEDFAAFYDLAMKKTLTYEQKLDAMEFVPVTSLMGKKVFSSYIDEVIRVYSQRGISLTHPSEAA